MVPEYALPLPACTWGRFLTPEDSFVSTVPAKVLELYPLSKGKTGAAGRAVDDCGHRQDLRRPVLPDGGGGDDVCRRLAAVEGDSWDEDLG